MRKEIMCQIHTQILKKDDPVQVLKHWYWHCVHNKMFSVKPNSFRVSTSPLRPVWTHKL
uniref:Uncharacterized protein n=1 Tax=Anguilla anguilla TaxID=7936 RepID=A0A0E9X8D2_ANGAN